MRERDGSSTGFTMVEVLVVIAIMAFLASLSFWGITEIRKGMKIKLSSATVSALSSGIRTFHTTFLEWPTQTMLDSLMPPQKWHEFLNGGYTRVPGPAGAKFESRTAFLELPGSALDTSGDVIDAWGNPVYIHVDAVKGAGLVYSFGPDGVGETPDDIVNKW